MSMRVVITQNLIDGGASTNISPEDPGAEWVGGTYNTGDERWKATTHRVYRVIVASTTDDPEIGVAADPPTWADVRPTSGYALFDGLNTTSSERTGSITVTYTSDGGLIGGIALYGLEALTVNITLTSAAAGGEFYNEDFSLQDYTPVIGFWEYLYSPLVLSRSLFVDDFVNYADTVVTITIDNDTDTARVANIAIGEKVFIGDALSGVSDSTRTFTKKTIGSTGQVFNNQGASRQLRGGVVIDAYNQSYVGQKIQASALKPVAMIVSDGFSNLNAFGLLSIDQGYTVGSKSKCKFKQEAFI